MSAATRTPRYVEIERTLRSRTALLESGARLATEAALCEEFGVSRMTARAALQRLERDGLVRRIPGRGTFVASGATAAHQDEGVGLAPAVELLEALAREQESGPSRLADLAGMRLEDVESLLAALVATGLAERSGPRGGYRLGLRLLRLGEAARRELRDVALPFMEELHRATEETVYLVVRRGDEGVCVERIEGLWIRSMVLVRGGSLPLHLGASPRALLAAEGAAEWDAYLARTSFDPLTPRSPITAAAVRAALEQARGAGYAVSDEDVQLGIASIGAVVRDDRGDVVGAISVGGPRPAILDDEAAMARLVLEATAGITRALGG